MDDIKTGDRFQLPAPSYMIMEAVDMEKHEILTVLKGKAGTWLISAEAIKWFVDNMGWKRVPDTATRIGDKFRNGKLFAEVVDLYIKESPEGRPVTLGTMRWPDGTESAAHIDFLETGLLWERVPRDEGAA